MDFGHNETKMVYKLTKSSIVNSKLLTGDPVMGSWCLGSSSRMALSKAWIPCKRWPSLLGSTCCSCSVDGSQDVHVSPEMVRSGSYFTVGYSGGDLWFSKLVRSGSRGT